MVVAVVAGVAVVANAVISASLDLALDLALTWTQVVAGGRTLALALALSA